MRSILAVDLGVKRVGVAIAEKGITIPLPLAILERRSAEKEILNLISERDVAIIVLGLPLNNDSTEGPLCKQVRDFARRLRKRTKVEIAFIDEYGSSFEAEELRQIAGKKGARVDAHAAALILQRYLDEAKTGRNDL